MSQSSDDDSNPCEDERQSNQQHTDYYATLNVQRDASIEEINKAYKQRCLIFHPDRHIDEDDRREAARIFVGLKKAHETLTNPHLRMIYDTVGISGLDMQGWQLATRSNNPEHIRKEYEFLKRLRENEIMLQQIHPTTNFVLKTSLVGLFQEDSEEIYFPQIVEMKLAQSVDCLMTTSDHFGLAGQVRNANGRGDGFVAATWRRAVSPYLHIESQAKLSPDLVTGSLMAAIQTSSKTMLTFQPMLQYRMLHAEVEPMLSTVFTMQFLSDWRGTIALNAGFRNNSVTTSLIHTELNYPKFSMDLTLTPTLPRIRLAYTKRSYQSDSFYEIESTANPMGIIPSINYETKLSRFSRIGVHLTVSFPSFFLAARFRLKTGLNSYQFQFVLCDYPDDITRSTIFGVIVPYVAFRLFRFIFRPQISRFLQLFECRSDEDEINEARKEDAQRVVHLMRSSAERIAKDEEAKSGLVIMEAQYGQMQNDVQGAELYPVAGDNVTDVTIPLQALVNDSQLRIYTNKDQLPGFYDPCPGEPKMLKVVYRFHGQLHSCTVADDRPLTIPKRAHCIEH